MSRYSNRPDPDSIAATELAKLGMCEKRMMLDRQFGPGRVSARAKQRQAEGRVIHERSMQAAVNHNAGAQQQPEDRRCFIATAVYGDEAWQTAELRSWRDRALSNNLAGRLFIDVYYQVSPVIARWLLRRPAAAVIVRAGLNWFIAATRRGD